MIGSIEITKSTPTPTPVSLSNKFGLDKTQNILLDNGTSFPVKYKITGGKVSNMDVERSSNGKSSLIVRIDPEVSEDSYQGKLVLEIPNMVLNSNRNFIAIYIANINSKDKLTAKGPLRSLSTAL